MQFTGISKYPALILVGFVLGDASTPLTAMSLIKGTSLGDFDDCSLHLDGIKRYLNV